MVTTVKYQGCTVRPIHLETMQTAARNTVGWGTLNLSQGGYSGFAASAGTHFKLDVVDIKVAGKSKTLV